MINQRRAFNRYTTASHTIQVYIPGYFDSKNNWVGETYSPPKRFRCTPIAYGDRDSGVAGQTLKATEIGERQPAFMQVHSTTEMPMNLYSIYTDCDIKSYLFPITRMPDSTGLWRQKSWRNNGYQARRNSSNEGNC